MSWPRALLILALSAAALPATGCMSLQDDVQADMEAADGERPNNYGRVVDGPDGLAVRPDRPTIPAVAAPGGGAGAAPDGAAAAAGGGR